MLLLFSCSVVRLTAKDTGGLFLGANAVIPTTGHSPVSQYQRNSIRGRLRYQIWTVLSKGTTVSRHTSSSEHAISELPVIGP